ncbi:hypothetical protein NP493_374g01019 [Ridgeia piscesae]|uniref:DNA topoisomerase 3-beta zinc ribbon domain-containing protein n=1 Tax=Ridgeia piscesae TaxID=27915 RepID=A0AAD9L3T5_RIDPI|nr:hypothetical protein NP493_374g01019 [Ridgeia piscesae]
MKFVQAKPSRLHCASCDDTYSLPQNGNIKLYKEIRCPLDHFELVLWTTGVHGKSYPLCPYCYNNPPFGDMRKGMGCNECTHPTCVHAMTQNSVSSCVECENGTLILDQASAPKWRMACNKCNVVINLLENAHKITIADTSCQDCQSAILDVVFNKMQFTFSHAAVVECDSCSHVLVCALAFHIGSCHDLAESTRWKRQLGQMKHARFRRNNPGRSRGGRGRGRGGRGGGRGKPKDKMSQLAAYFV